MGEVCGGYDEDGRYYLLYVDADAYSRRLPLEVYRRGFLWKTRAYCGTCGYLHPSPPDNLKTTKTTSMSYLLSFGDLGGRGAPPLPLEVCGVL